MRVKNLVMVTAILVAACSPPDGPYEDHHSNGKVKEQGAYKDGEKVGKWMFYWKTGLKKAEGFYSKGVPAGTWTYYNSSGAVIGKGTYRDGKMWSGTFVRYIVGTTKIMRFKDGEEDLR